MKKKPVLHKQGFIKIRQSLPGLMLLLLVGCAFFFWRVHQVDGQSMMPTLQNQDRYIVRKTKQLKRYDIISFRADENQYVKRVIGLPGDKIFVVEGRIYLRPIEAGTIPELGELGTWDSTLCVHAEAVVLQALANDTEIPSDHYFVLGDNRQSSKDSRSLGLVDAEQIEGVAFFRYYPLTRLGLLK